jgi:hypothetical protein
MGTDLSQRKRRDRVCKMHSRTCNPNETLGSSIYESLLQRPCRPGGPSGPAPAGFRLRLLAGLLAVCMAVCMAAPCDGAKATPTHANARVQATLTSKLCAVGKIGTLTAGCMYVPAIVQPERLAVQAAEGKPQHIEHGYMCLHV